MKIFIVVLNWNQPKLTIETIESLQRLKTQKDYQVKIVVVDNGSIDKSVEEFRKLRPKKFGLEIMESGMNLGFAGGNNFGIRYALDHFADYVLVVNNDIEVDENLLIELLKPFKDSRVGISSPKIYFAKGYEFHKDRYRKKQLGKIIWYAGGKMNRKNVLGSNKGVDEVDRGQYEKQQEIDFATGACFLVNAKVLKDVGLFNEKYFMYMEDADFSMRVRHKNYRIVFTPKAILWHKVSQSSGIGSGLNDYFISRNRMMFGFKYATLKTKLALIRESLRLFMYGRHWQAVGVRDFYLRKFGKGSWK